MVLVAVGFLIACGGGNDQAGPTAETTAAPITAPTTSAAPRTWTRAELEPALLDGTETPSGYAKASVDLDGHEIGLCGKSPVRERGPIQSDAKVSYTKSQAGPILYESVESFSSVDEAKRYMNELKGDISCGTYEDDFGTPVKVKVTLSQLPYPVIGDEKFALRMASSGTGDIVHMRNGNVIVVLMSAGSGNTTVDESLARKAFDKANSTLKL